MSACKNKDNKHLFDILNRFVRERDWSLYTNCTCTCWWSGHRRPNCTYGWPLFSWQNGERARAFGGNLDLVSLRSFYRKIRVNFSFHGSSKPGLRASFFQKAFPSFWEYAFFGLMSRKERVGMVGSGVGGQEVSAQLQQASERTPAHFTHEAKNPCSVLRFLQR